MGGSFPGLFVVGLFGVGLFGRRAVSKQRLGVGGGDVARATRKAPYNTMTLAKRPRKSKCA